MVTDVIVSVVSTLGIDAIKGYISDKYDTKKLKDEIRDFANKEFEARYKHLALSDDVDFGGLLSRISTDYIDEIRVYLFDVDVSVRKRCLESIVEKTYNYAGAVNNAKKSEIKRFVEISIEIARQYFIGKLDGKYKLLNNITIDTILDSLSYLIIRELDEAKTQIIDAVKNEIFDVRSATSLVKDTEIDASYESSLHFSDKFNSVLFGESKFTSKIRMCDVYIEPMFSYEKRNDSFENIFNELRNGLGFVIEGAAGIGKSSFVTYLASRYTQGDSANPFKKQKVYFVQGKDIRNSKGNTVSDISKALKMSTDKLLALKNAVLVIDAYDEISYASMNKESNMQYFSSLLSNFNHLFLIVTSRSGYISGKMLPNVQMLSFTTEQIRTYLEIYNSKRLKQEQLSAELIDSLVTSVDEYLVDVVSIPLFLYMIITNDIDVGVLEDIYDLYERIFYKNNGITHSTLSARGGDAKDIRVTSISVAEEVTALAEHIAHRMHCADSLYISEKEITGAIAKITTSEDTKSKLMNLFCIEIYLQADSERIFTFVHKSIYEFFAAKYIGSSLYKLLLEYLQGSIAMSDAVKVIMDIFAHDKNDAGILMFHTIAINRYHYIELLKHNTEPYKAIEKFTNELLYRCLSDTSSNLGAPFWKQQYIMLRWVFSCLTPIFFSLAPEDERFLYDTDGKKYRMRVDAETAKYVITMNGLQSAEYNIKDESSMFVLCYLDFSYVDFVRLHFETMMILSCDFYTCKITNCRFEEVVFTSQCFHRVFFRDCVFKNCDFSEETIFIECVLRGVDFSGQDLSNVKFINCDMRDAEYWSANMASTVFDGTHVYNEDFVFEERHIPDSIPNLEKAIVHEFTEEDAELDVLDFWGWDN